MSTTARNQSSIELPLASTADNRHDRNSVGTAASSLEILPAGRIIIEIAGVCQAKCPYCAQNSGRQRRREKPAAYMPVDLFRSVVERLSTSEAVASGKIDRVYLYNWGEPFLAPSFNEYLEILKAKGLFAVISSNFQKVPAISSENLPVINEVLFSVSGMSQGTYGRIHGGSIDTVLANFETFHAQLRRYSPTSKIFMSWHRYTFNEHEFWSAYRYCRDKGIGFIPSVAFLNDLVELIQAAGGHLPDDRRQDAQRDIFFDHMVEAIRSYRGGASEYRCPAWDDVVVDERGRMLVCCGTDAQTSVGDALALSYEEMRRRKMQSSICRACKEKGVAEWAHNNFHDRNQLPWPPGGGMDRVRLRASYVRLRLKNDARHLLNQSAVGGLVIEAYRRFQRR